MRVSTLLWPVLATLAAASCAAPDEPTSPRGRSEATEREVPVAPRSSQERFYRISRQDLRKCAWPWCGGVFVAELNQPTSRCADGGDEPDCYVAQIDYSALALDPDSVAALPDVVIVRGTLAEVSHSTGSIPSLKATGVWQAVTSQAPSGGYYLVQPSGIVCITHPCPTLQQIELNTQQSSHVHGLDLTPSGASASQIDSALAELAGAGLLVAGGHVPVEGPGGQGSELVASAFYTELATAKGEPCGDVVCGPGTSCCNASCSMCVPEGMACIQIACSPCAHAVCETGAALEPSCSSCASTVCAADAYCCDHEWDGICVEEAKNLCGACAEPPPPPPSDCAHDPCSTGAALEPGCSSCAQSVCNVDSFCCQSSWDALCVEQARSLCSECASAPGCAHPESQTGDKLTPACSSCAAAVCAQDAFCCDSAWDGLCVSQALQLCP